MQNGDFVSGIPTSARFRKEVSGRVTGNLETTDVEFSGSHWTLYQIHVQYPDGTDVPIDVEEASLTMANRRRATTTIPFPEYAEADDGD